MNGRTNSNPTTTVIDVTKSPFATLPPSDINSLRGNQKIDISWVNPVTEVATPGGYVVAKRAYTSVIRNEDHFPTSLSDGIEIYRDTNQTDGSAGVYNDTNLTNGKNYYYGLISVTDNNISSEVATTQNIPSGGIIHTGTIDSLTTENYWNGYSKTAAATADNTYAIFLPKLSNSRYDDNVNTYNSALVKNVFTLASGLFGTSGTSSYPDLVGVSIGDCAVFCGAAGSWKSNYYDYKLIIFAYNSNLTLSASSVNDQMLGTDPVGVAFNDGALVYASNNGSNYYNNVWKFINSNFTYSNLSINSEGRSACGMGAIDSIAALGPGSSKNKIQIIDFINNNLTKIRSVNTTYYGIYITNTKDHIIYSACGSLYAPNTEHNTYAYSNTLTSTLISKTPDTFNEGNPWGATNFGEYGVLFNTNGICAYDQFLTQSIPESPNINIYQVGATDVNDHLIITAPSGTSVAADVYSI